MVPVLHEAGGRVFNVSAEKPNLNSSIAIFLKSDSDTQKPPNCNTAKFTCLI